MASKGSDTGSPVARALLEVLCGWGVKHVFTCPGSTEAAFLDATLGRADVRVLLTTHESVAVSMADGYSQATGRPSVAYLHTNVGLTNGLAHLYAAGLARSPVVVLNGLKSTAVQAHQGFTTAPQMRDFVRQYVKWDWTSSRAAAVPEDVNRAIRVATTEPCGPTWLGLPQDYLESPDEVTVPRTERFVVRARPRPDPQLLDRAADLLARADRPLLVAGSEVARHGATETVAALAERLGAPVLNEDRRTFQRPGFPSTHPLFAGMYDPGRAAVRDADVVFFVGCHVFTEFEEPAGAQIPPHATVIHSHIDADEIGRIHGVDVPLVGHQAMVLADLLAALPATDPRPAAREHLRVAREEWRQATVTGWDTRSPGHGRAVDDAVAAVAESVDDATTVVGDATTAGGLLLRDLPQHSTEHLFTSSSGSLGWGMGAALGIKLGLPHRDVVAVVGDGVFQFGVQALWAAVRYRIPVTFLVLNNRTYAAVAAALHRYGGVAAAQGRYPGSDIAGPDIVGISEGFGVPARRVDDTARLPEALKESRSAGGPTVIEVITGPDPDSGQPLA